MAVSRPPGNDNEAELLVRARMLGPFAIYRGDKAAGPWPRLSAKRLVALVLLSPQRRISREVASDILFSELPPQSAANALYNALWSARAVLSDLGGPAILIASRRDIYIPSGAPVEVDLELYERSMEAALAMQPGDDRDIALTEALSEQGTLLEDEPYADWSLRRRESLELARQDARVALARDRSMGFGRSSANAVIQAWEAVFSHDLASEEAAAALMAAYGSQGQRQLVARTYNRCRGGLDELGLQPSVALDRAYQRAKDEVPDSQWPLSAATSGVTSNLPIPLSSFIGREAEQAEVSSLLRSSALVTVTGSGGSGKTRLALEVAAQLHAEERVEVSLVELAPVTEAAQVGAAFAGALGVRSQVNRPPDEVLAEALSGQDLLVVMDNCEHVIGAAAELAAAA